MNARHTKLLALVLVGSCVSGPALACSCIPRDSARAQLANADVMFLGRVAETRRTGRPPGSDEMVTRFTVQRTIKGTSVGAREVAHDVESAACGLTFQPGQSYAVMARSNSAGLTTSLCMLPRFPISDYDRAVKRGR